MEPTPSQPSFVLIPGGFCPGSVYDKVSALLLARGYASHQVDLPSVSLPPPSSPSPSQPHTADTAGSSGQPATFADDVTHVRNILSDLLTQQAPTDVILVANSYAGFVATQAASGLHKPSLEPSQPSSSSSSHGVIHIIYLASILPPPGMRVHELMGERGRAVASSGLTHMDVPPLEHVAANMCPGLEESETRELWGRMGRHSVASLSGEITAKPAWLEIPCTAVITTEDGALKGEVQSEYVERARGVGAQVRSVELRAGHLAMLSHPGEVVDALLSVV